MKNLTKLFVVVLLVSASFLSAKGKYGVIGKIYTADRAVELYGSVLKSVEMEKSDILAMLDNCEDYMMFTIKNSEVVVTDDNRNVLTNNKIYLTSSILNYVSKNDAISEDEVLNVFSKNRVLELIKKSGSNTVNFEQRNNVSTISAGKYTMELAIIVW